jgi:molybdate transport system substrate-binding protein
MSHGTHVTILLLAFAFSTSDAEQLTIAVASNFLRPAQDLAERFEAASGHSVRISAGSTGKLYAQITNGAPFDVLLAADRERPELLEESGLGISGSRFTYALGGLVLWSRDPALSGSGCRSQLENLGLKRLAIANPLTAPYGAAAMEFLQAEGVLDQVRPRLVHGENIAQTLHFVVSGNASLGLIARAQATDDRLPEATCRWPVPDSMHEAIEQQAIQLRTARDNEAARDFLKFLHGPTARQVISAHGYKVAN